MFFFVCVFVLFLTFLLSCFLLCFSFSPHFFLPCFLLFLPCLLVFHESLVTSLSPSVAGNKRDCRHWRHLRVLSLGCGPLGPPPGQGLWEGGVCTECRGTKQAEQVVSFVCVLVGDRGVNLCLFRILAVGLCVKAGHFGYLLICI